MQDKTEEIENIEWTVTGKVKKIERYAFSEKPDLAFEYDPVGRRIMKVVYPKSAPGVIDTDEITKTYYVHDAQGNVMSIYTLKTEDSEKNLYLSERMLYGSTRLGMEQVNQIVASTNSGNIDINTAQQRVVGDKRYELSNHLGNVLATVTDRKLPEFDATESLAYYKPDVVSYSDYMPFGMQMAERNGSTGDYRYGFGSKEKDNEIKGEGNSLDFGARMLDTRLGRWLSLDPLMDEYPSMSPYCYAANMPIVASDPDGKAVIIKTTTSSYDGKTPTKIGEIAVTKGSYSFSFNTVTNEWDLIVNNHIQYSSAFNKAGANGKTLEQENPGLLQSSKIHEGVHVDRNIKAANSSISYTTHLLNGGAKTFTGTADKVLTDIFNAYTLQRGTERADLVKKQVSSLEAKYNPLIAAANGDATKIADLNKQAQAEYDAWANTTLQDFDKKTNDNIKLLATKILDKVNKKSASLNVHEGTSGVNAEASKKMPAGSNAQKYQDGKLPIKSQGKTLSN